MSTPHECKPAADIIERLGGTARVAAILDRDESTIRRWRMAPPAGTGGKVPHDAAVALIEFAFAEGIDLTWNDFRPSELNTS